MIPNSQLIRCMAKNILGYPNFNECINFFWAANAHVDARSITESYEDQNDKYLAGFYLKEKLGDQYMIILTTSYQRNIRFSSICSDDECTNRTFPEKPIHKSFIYKPYKKLIKNNPKYKFTEHTIKNLNNVPIIEFSDAVFPDGSKYQPRVVNTNTYDMLIFFNKVTELPLMPDKNSINSVNSVNSINSMDNYKIISDLGYGMMGSVYLVSDENHHKYAMKIEHILKKDIIESMSSGVWHEIEFANYMNDKYPDYFVKLHDYWIDFKCTHIQDWSKIGMNIKSLPLEQQKFYNKLFASPYCSVKIWSLVDLTLKDLINKNISLQTYYDLFLQTLYVLWLVLTWKII